MLPPLLLAHRIELMSAKPRDDRGSPITRPRNLSSLSEGLVGES